MRENVKRIIIGSPCTLQVHTCLPKEAAQQLLHFFFQKPRRLWNFKKEYYNICKSMLINSIIHYDGNSHSVLSL